MSHSRIGSVVRRRYVVIREPSYVATDVQKQADYESADMTLWFHDRMASNLTERNTPELRLVAAVLRDALNILGGGDHSARDSHLYHARALDWVTEPNAAGGRGFTFSECCDFLGLETSRVRSTIMQNLASPPARWLKKDCDEGGGRGGWGNRNILRTTRPRVEAGRRLAKAQDLPLLQGGKRGA